MECRGTALGVRKDVKAWAPFVVVCALAAVRAIVAAAPESALPSDDDMEHKLFRAVASEESNMRHEAAKGFPTDLWSRDDDFHRLEGRRVREWAGNHHMRLSDAMRAVDEGLRARWPQGNPGPLLTSTPPCRPRAIY